LDYQSVENQTVENEILKKSKSRLKTLLLRNMPPKKLDSGGQGQIYEVDKDTVYKIIKFSDHYKEISELAILHSLPHPCMIKMKKWELNRNECKIYMERMHSNIYDFAKKSTFEKRLELFPRIFWTMVRVARFFQCNGIMNCDIKSENVMVSKDGTNVKIIDFGHIISDESYPIIGTRSYQPPELWTEDKYSYKSMVWSIGMTCLEFLYRIHPIVDIIYGEDSDSDSESLSYTSSEQSEQEGSYSSTDSDDEYRQKYTNLFELLMEEGKSLPFRHRLEQPSDPLREKIRNINNMIERMLTYDVSKRISLDELYHHRIFDNIRQGVKDEPVVTRTREQLFCDKELTPVFMTVGRKLFREEIMYQAYTLLSIYLEKRPKPNRRDFTITSIACMDIMSYVFSMVPSSRDLYRTVVLRLRNMDENQIFDRVIEILKSVQFNIFFNTIIDTIKKQDDLHVLYPLLMELIELDAEAGKKGITSAHLLEKYMSSDIIEDEKEDEKDEEEEEEEVREVSKHKVQRPHPSKEVSKHKSPLLEKEDKEQVQKKSTQQKQPTKANQPTKASLPTQENQTNTNLNKQTKPEKQSRQSVQSVETEVKEVKVKEEDKMDKPKNKKQVIIHEYDLSPDFLDRFKEQIRMVHQQEILKKIEEEEQGDILIIEL